MRKTFLLLVALVALTGSALANACTSTGTGNWSAPGTWSSCGGGVPGTGDTASIGAHTITVDVNTAVGTSPNNTTTKVIDMTSASSVLSVASGITLTVLGNIGHVNGSTHTQAAGSTVTFDNSGSGGTPVYTFINGGFSKFNFNGSLGSVATIQAISGQTFGMGVAISGFTATYALFKRCSNLTCTSLNGNLAISDSTFDTCAQLNITCNVATNIFTLDRNAFTSGTGSNDFNVSDSNEATSGTRRFSGNVLSKLFNYVGKTFTITSNYFGGGISLGAATTGLAFRLNFIKSDGTQNGGNGQLLSFSVERNYWVVDKGTGNPHFIAPTAKNSVDNLVTQNIFEGHTPDLVDTGDCILVNNTATSGGFKIIGKNNIDLQMSTSGATVTSGTMITLFSLDSASVTEWYRNTANIDDSAVVGKRGAFAIAEGNNGTAGQVAALKSNLVWGRLASQGYFGERVTGNVKDIITAAGADYNWTYNLSAGDNQRGYEDRAASNTLWTAGDAVAASVDTHQGSGNPNFYDSSRNVAAWATARGYGDGSYSAALTALQAAPSTRIADLIAYVFEGFRPGNASMRNAAHDGGVVGAANYYKSTRTTSGITAHRAKLAKFGL